MKNDLKQLAGVAATVKNENGLEVFYDVAITPAIRPIPNYQHIWNTMTARVAKNEPARTYFFFARVRHGEGGSFDREWYLLQTIKC